MLDMTSEKEEETVDISMLNISEKVFHKEEENVETVLVERGGEYELVDSKLLAAERHLIKVSVLQKCIGIVKAIIPFMVSSIKLSSLKFALLMF